MTQILFGDRIGKEGEIRVGCAAVIFDETRKKILLTRRADTGQWCLPSGGMEPGESVTETCIREVFEETGLEVRVIRLTSICSNQNRLVIYEDGHRFQIVSLNFEAETIGGVLRLSDETTEVGFFTPGNIGSMDIFSHHKQFIHDTLEAQDAAFVR
jgi:ADP-ribose pyrophosphatase YjhB (NUDIX family)